MAEHVTHRGRGSKGGTLLKDPHVARLVCALIPQESVSFVNPRPIEDDTEEFHMSLEDGVMAFEMKQH